MNLTPEVIQKLKAQHGEDLAVFQAQKSSLVFRKPTFAEFNRFVDETDQHSKVPRSVVFRNLVSSCFCYPTNADGKPDLALYQSALECQPGIASQVIDMLLEFAGAGEELKASALKKL